jgi:hypothetical protein
MILHEIMVVQYIDHCVCWLQIVFCQQVVVFLSAIVMKNSCLEVIL